MYLYTFQFNVFFFILGIGDQFKADSPRWTTPASKVYIVYSIYIKEIYGC